MGGERRTCITTERRILTIQGLPYVREGAVFPERYFVR